MIVVIYTKNRSRHIFHDQPESFENMMMMAVADNLALVMEDSKNGHVIFRANTIERAHFHRVFKKVEAE